MEEQPAKKARIGSSPLLSEPIIIAISRPFMRGNNYKGLMSVVISGRQSLAAIQEHPDEGSLARQKSY